MKHREQCCNTQMIITNSSDKERARERKERLAVFVLISDDMICWDWTGLGPGGA